MRIAIIDDDRIQQKQLHDMIADKLTEYGYTGYIIDMFQSGEVFLEKGFDDFYDIIVVDIYMGKLTGIDLARKIRSIDEEVRIVFCSSSNEFAAESYELNASYYIRKPVSSRQVGLMLKRMNLDVIEKNRTVMLPDGHRIVLRDIIYTDYFNHAVTIHMKGAEPYRIRISQNQMEMLLLDYDYFFSPVKGIIVNFYEVVRSTDEDFVLRNGRTVHITRRKSREAKERYLKLRFDRLKRESVG